MKKITLKVHFLSINVNSFSNGASQLYYTFGEGEPTYLCTLKDKDQIVSIRRSTTIQILFNYENIYILLIEMKRLNSQSFGKMDFSNFIYSACDSLDPVFLDCNIHLKESSGLVSATLHFTGSINPYEYHYPERVEIIIPRETSRISQSSSANSRSSRPISKHLENTGKRQVISLTSYQKKYPRELTVPEKYPIYDKTPVKACPLSDTLQPRIFNGSSSNTHVSRNDKLRSHSIKTQNIKSERPKKTSSAFKRERQADSSLKKQVNKKKQI